MLEGRAPMAGTSDTMGLCECQGSKISTAGVSDMQKLVEDEDEGKCNTVVCRRCGGCGVIIEPLLMLFMLLHYPMGLLVPQYVQQQELEWLTGQDNLTMHKNRCMSVGNNTTNDDPFKGNLSLASSAASYFELEKTFVSSVPAIFAIMFLGAFSDHAGRRYAIIVPIVGQMLALFVCTATMFFKWPVQVILMGYFIFGCCGLNSNFYTGCYSYIADITTKEKRSFRLIMAHLCVSVSAIVSTSGSGYLVNLFGFLWVFLFMSITNILILLYAIFLVPETIIQKPNSHLLTFSHIKKAFTVILVDDGSRRRWKLLLLLAALFAERLVAGSQNSIDTLFTMNRPLCWGPELVGDYSSVRHAVSMVTTGFIIWVCGSFVRDAWFCIIAGVSDTAANTFRVFVTTTTMMFCSTIINFASPFFTSTLRSMLSKLVKADETGAVLSSVGVCEVVGALLGHFISNPLYSVTELSGHSSAVYLYMASCYLICTIIMGVYAFLTRVERRKPSLTTEATQDGGK